MRRYSKAFAAVLAAGLQTAQTQIPMSAAAHGWVAVAIAVVAAGAVYAIPNQAGRPQQ